MKINLERNNLFNTDELSIDNKTCFIFGNNGTGKSTLAQEIKESQQDNCDVRIFQGFNSVINENEELNTVVLGEENVEIDNKINQLTQKRNNIYKDLDREKRKIDKSLNQENNVYTELINAENAYNEQSDVLNKFYDVSVSKIKKYKPVIANNSYDKNNFKEEINSALKLSNDEIQKCKKIIETKIKKAKKIDFPEYDLYKLRKEVLELYNTVIRKKPEIPRLKDSNERCDFARKGLEIHSKGDVCSFCGNKLEIEVLYDLEKYLLNDEVQVFKDKLLNKSKQLEQYRKEINSLDINIDDFYAEYEEESFRIISQLIRLRGQHYLTYNFLIRLINERLEYMFIPLGNPRSELPEDFSEISERYNNLVEKNNNSNIEALKIEAKKKLRLNKISKFLVDFNYREEINKLDRLKYNYDRYLKKVMEIKDKIACLDEKATVINNEIASLKRETMNENILANKINFILEPHVNFKLIHEKNEQNGLYKIKNKHSNIYRKVTELSSGEKNIIAFLYFFKKLEDIKHSPNDKKLIVIFDDPMTSNDSGMQYVIIDVLKSLIDDNSSALSKYISNIFILTHNHHFYINLTHNYRSYSKHTFIQLQSNGFKTTIKEISNKKDDIRTQYRTLWQDLKYVYESEELSESLLCNLMRRIIETYSIFNFIETREFYKNSKDAQKLFNVNSHDISDHTTDLTGIDKETIMRLFKKCFKENNGLEHFNKHWFQL
ncbi:AAA family ATPase [Dolosigranulum pigrum]|uniref:AAA family ATPase n=1 Tax=Dolosigranulum pigrum TaxID=29394 RepID=UPI001AD88F08|nr:AAA family ATPase [Dolosigranulum pigrum]QTJ46514.1 hypothetical protein FE329_03900 [Dolosigranulum pigrum]QTJ60038.1 hypothetical protein FE337_03970 [Dolosigranulum pigrum]